MSKNTPKDRPQQPRQTLSDVRKQFIHDLITRAESLTLDRIITQARGTCTRAEVAKAVDALTVEGSVFVHLKPWGIQVEVVSPLQPTIYRRAGSSKKEAAR